MIERVTIYADGLCEPNPGGVAIFGWIAYGWENGLATEIGRESGKAEYGAQSTNNVAEYVAVGKALKWARDNTDVAAKVALYTDSQLVVKQISGEWACNAETLKPLMGRCQQYMRELGATLEWIPREQNEEADLLTRRTFKDITGRYPPERRKGAK